MSREKWVAVCVDMGGQGEKGCSEKVEGKRKNWLMQVHTLAETQVCGRAWPSGDGRALMASFCLEAGKINIQGRQCFGSG